MVNRESIVLGGGCFWCLEAAYRLVKGVTDVIPGYSGGTVTNPTYEMVCSGTTGHAEVVMVTFDPEKVTLSEILAMFWVIHDPTSLNRQGADVGTEYASVIFYENENDLTSINESRHQAQALLDNHIVTRIEPLGAFYEAEDYHRNYFEKNTYAGYCQVVIEPKLQKLRKHFSSLLVS